MGVDLVAEHVQAVRERDSEAEVVLASWRNLPFTKDEFKGAYVMGRSLLHEYEVEGMVLALREIGRVTGGKIVLDLPNADKGHYLKERKRFAKAVEKLGVSYYEGGAIVDSPNGENFFDRLAPSEAQFRAIARLAGFEARVIERREYTDEEGEENENVYWRLTKLERPMGLEEALESMVEARQSGPPIRVFRI